MKAINSVTKKYFPPGTPLVEEVLKKTDLILVNTHNVMGYARPNVPLVVEIGGLHIKPYKPLPNDLEEFISGSGEHGFIYFSLGTLVQESTVSDNVVQAFLNVFRKLPQRVLWKWNGKMRNVPPNVKISQWFPQSDILGKFNNGKPTIQEISIKLLFQAITKSNYLFYKAECFLCKKPSITECPC